MFGPGRQPTGEEARMSTDRAEAGIEIVIAEHVATSFEGRAGKDKGDATVTLIRNRFTDSFPAAEIHTEQDNRPPALVSLYRRIAAAFAPATMEPHPTARASQLADLKGAITTLRSAKAHIGQSQRLERARASLMAERHLLFLKNEFTEGFGRIESWILSITFLVLVLLESVNLLWALPILGLSIARAWQLERQCKRRLKKMAEIDALIGRIDIFPHGAAGSVLG
jgi:hypothetical protein